MIVGVTGFFVMKRLNKPAEEIQTKELPTVTLTRLSTGDISRETALMGTIQPSDTYYVMPKISGEILEVFVENGDRVEAGSPIVRLDNQKAVDAARYTLEQTQVQANTAASSLARITALFQAGDVSAQDFEGVQAQAEAAAAQVRSAQLNYDTQVEFSTVTAPAGGIIQNANLTVNAMAAPGNQLCIITGTGAKQVLFNVTEDILRNLQPGQEVTVEKNGSEYKGSISEIGQVVNQQTGLFPIKATLENAEALPDGASCKLRIISSHAENVQLIPLDCIYYSGGMPYVYVYSNGKANRAFLTLGIQNETEAQVIEGINMSQDIVNSWTNEIYDGASVKVA